MSSSELLLKLIYPSMDTAGNIYYSQTKKLAFDAYKNDDLYQLESFIPAISTSGATDKEFTWKFGPLRASYKITGLYSIYEGLLEAYSSAAVYLKYALSVTSQEYVEISDATGVQVPAVKNSITPTFVTLATYTSYVQDTCTGPDGTADDFQVMFEDGTYYAYIRLMEKGESYPLRFAVRYGGSLGTLNQPDSYVPSYMTTFGYESMYDSNPLFAPRHINRYGCSDTPSGDKTAITGDIVANYDYHYTDPTSSEERVITTHPHSVSQFIYGNKSFQDIVECKNTIRGRFGVLAPTDFETPEIQAKGYTGSQLHSAPMNTSSYLSCKDIRSSFATAIYSGDDTNNWKARTILESRHHSATGTSIFDVNEECFTDYIGGAAVFADSKASSSRVPRDSCAVHILAGFNDKNYAAGYFSNSEVLVKCDGTYFYSNDGNSYRSFDKPEYSDCSHTFIAASTINVISKSSTVDSKITLKTIGTNRQTTLKSGSITINDGTRVCLNINNQETEGDTLNLYRGGSLNIYDSSSSNKPIFEVSSSTSGNNFKVYSTSNVNQPQFLLGVNTKISYSTYADYGAEVDVHKLRVNGRPLKPSSTFIDPTQENACILCGINQSSGQPRGSWGGQWLGKYMCAFSNTSVYQFDDVQKVFETCCSEPSSSSSAWGTWGDWTRIYKLYADNISAGSLSTSFMSSLANGLKIPSPVGSFGLFTISSSYKGSSVGDPVSGSALTPASLSVVSDSVRILSAGSSPTGTWSLLSSVSSAATGYSIVLAIRIA